MRLLGSVRRALPCALLLVAAIASRATAQGDVRFSFYHGNKGASSWVEPTAGDAYRRIDNRRITLHERAGSRVCVMIVNGHPVNYAYSFAIAVDSSSPAMPDLSKQIALLKDLFQPTKAVLTGAAPVPAAPEDPKLVALRTFIDSLKILDVELADARKAVDASDQAEPLSGVANYYATGAGLRYAQDFLRKLPSTRGHFNDKGLKDAIDAWAKVATDAMKGDTLLKTAVVALKGLGDANRETRDQLKKSIGEASTRPQICETVTKGTTTLTLKAAQKDTSAARARTFDKDELFTILNEAPIERKRVELHPVALGVTAPSQSDFFVENGVLRADHSRVFWRPGVLVDGFVGSTADGMVGLTVGLGVATDAKDAPISDLFVAGGVDFFNVFRVGLGVGASNIPTHVKNLAVNSAFPADKKLADEVVRGWRPAFYLNFVLPGFSPSW